MFHYVTIITKRDLFFMLAIGFISLTVVTYLFGIYPISIPEPGTDAGSRGDLTIYNHAGVRGSAYLSCVLSGIVYVFFAAWMTGGYLKGNANG